MTQRDRIPLPVRQSRDMSKQRAVLNAVLRQAGGVLGAHWLMLHGSLQLRSPAMSAEVVEGRVSSDAKQPCRRGRVASLEPSISLVRLHENLRGDVLSVSRARDLCPDIRVDAPEEVAVKVLERRPIGKHGRMVCIGTLI